MRERVKGAGLSSMKREGKERGIRGGEETSSSNHKTIAQSTNSIPFSESGLK